MHSGNKFSSVKCNRFNEIVLQILLSWESNPVIPALNNVAVAYSLWNSTTQPENAAQLLLFATIFLFQVDGVNIQGFTNQEVVEALRNTGQTVRLTLLRRRPSFALSSETPSGRGNSIFLAADFIFHSVYSYLI